MMKRDECFRILARHIGKEAVVATYSSAVDWVDIAPRPLNYLSIGAMGLDSSHGLGLALGRPDRRVVVLQGDGSRGAEDPRLSRRADCRLRGNRHLPYAQSDNRFRSHVQERRLCRVLRL